MLLLIVLVVNVLIAGGLGYVVISNQKTAAAAQAAVAAAAKHKGDGEEGEAEAEEGHEGGGEAKEEEEGEGHAKKAGGKFGPLVEIGSFVANLTSSVPNGPPRYAKVAVFVEAANEDGKTKVEAAVVPIKAESLMYLSGLTAEAVIGQEKIRGLQDELLKRVNGVVGKGVVKRVYFSEFVVQ